MNAKIDIKTPAGQSLEGFPQEFEFESSIEDCLFASTMDTSYNALKSILHKGDKITIEITE